MSRDRVFAYTLVVIQFACLGAVVLTGPLIARNPIWLAAEVAAGMLAVWALISARIGNFNIAPTVRTGAELITRGPYRFIRHPMYASLLLACLALVGNAPTWWRWALWLVLAVDLMVKLSYEERLLVGHFPGYADYRRQTRRLIPFVY